MSSAFYEIEPRAAPRQTQRDRFKPSLPVQRYRTFRDEVWRGKVRIPADFFHVVFLMAIPPSLSKAEKAGRIGRPHTLRPDADNLVKALIDAVYRGREDGHLWNYAVTKLWAPTSGILISDEFTLFDPTLPSLAEVLEAAGIDGSR